MLSELKIYYIDIESHNWQVTTKDLLHLCIENMKNINRWVIAKDVLHLYIEKSLWSWLPRRKVKKQNIEYFKLELIEKKYESKVCSRKTSENVNFDMSSNLGMTKQN